MFPIHPVLRFGVPQDFPVQGYTRVNDLFRRIETNDDMLLSRYRQCAGAWNSVAFRYRLCAEADIGFTALHTGPDVNLSHDEKLQRANYLFTFFAAGQAAIESLAYSTFAMGSLLDAEKFPIDTFEEQQKINLSLTATLLQQHFPSFMIGSRLDSLNKNLEFVRWKGIRNIVAHRHHPTETIQIHVGGPPVPVKELFNNIATPGPTKRATPHIDDVVLDAMTTRTRRAWLAAQLDTLIKAAGDFAALYFETFPAK